MSQGYHLEDFDLHAQPPWICDICGETIDAPEDGNLAWESSFDQPAPTESMSFCHKSRSSCNSSHLESSWRPTFILTPDGLVMLLSHVADSLITLQAAHIVVMRLYVPGYDRAIQYSTQPPEGGSPEHYLHPSDIELILEEHAQD